MQIGASFTPPACCAIYRTVRAEACGNIELTFDDLLDQLHTGHDAPCVEEALEAKHWTHAAFYPPVILFDISCKARMTLRFYKLRSDASYIISIFLTTVYFPSLTSCTS